MIPVIVSNFLSPRHGGEFILGFYQEFITEIMGISAVLIILAIIGISRKDKEEYFGLVKILFKPNHLKTSGQLLKATHHYKHLR